MQTIHGSNRKEKIRRLADMGISSGGAVPPVPAGFSAAENMERDLERRFSRPARVEPEVVFEFTRDPGFLQQYYNLRERMYISVWGLQEFNGQEDEFDRKSHILVARKGNMVVGGARITVKTPRMPNLLPMEGRDINLERQITDLKLRHCRYGEFSRLALLPEYRGGEYTQAIYEALNRKSIALNLKYVFAISPVAQARSYKKSYMAMGFDYTIRNDVTIPDNPEFEGIKMCLSVLDLSQYYSGSADTVEQVDSTDELSDGSVPVPSPALNS